jgi:hypothetical protein
MTKHLLDVSRRAVKSEESIRSSPIALVFLGFLDGCEFHGTGLYDSMFSHANLGGKICSHIIEHGGQDKLNLEPWQLVRVVFHWSLAEKKSENTIK